MCVLQRSFRAVNHGVKSGINQHILRFFPFNYSLNSKTARLSNVVHSLSAGRHSYASASICVVLYNLQNINRQKTRPCSMVSSLYWKFPKTNLHVSSL